MNKNVEVLKEAMNDGERKSHVVLFPRWIVRGSAAGRCTRQTIIPGELNTVTGVNKNLDYVGVVQQK